MRNTVAGFAIIRMFCGDDYLSAFIPLVIRVIDKKGYSSVNVEQICKDFEPEYGFNVPSYPMQTILNKMRSNYFTRRKGNYYIKDQELIRHEAEELDRSYEGELEKTNDLLLDFIAYAKEITNDVEITLKQAEEALVRFFKENDVNILFAAENGDKISPIPEIKHTYGLDIKSLRYLFNRYANDLLTNQEKNPSIAQHLINIAIGHVYTSTVFYREFMNMRGKGVCENYYLDIGIIFDLIGLNEEFRKISVQTFLRTITSLGANLYIFKHTYEELLGILNSCMKWINHRQFDASKASRAMWYFKQHRFNTSDIQIFIRTVDSILDRFEIKVIQTPDPNSLQEYQISYENLEKVINDVYDKNIKHGIASDNSEEEEEFNLTLHRDITSISSIYKLRKGNFPININDVKHVLITTNHSLAYATKVFEQYEFSKEYFTIPATLTDVFAGTLLWIQNPIENNDEIAMLNRSKMISYSAAQIRPGKRLLRKFHDEVNDALEKHKIDETTATILLESTTSLQLLSDQVLGDADRITPETLFEIQKKWEDEIITPHIEKVKEGQEEIENLQSELNREKSEKLAIQTESMVKEQNRIKFISDISSRIRWGVTGILGVLLLIIFLGDVFNIENTPVRVIGAVFSFLGFFGFNFSSVGNKVENKISKYLKQKIL